MKTAEKRREYHNVSRQEYYTATKEQSLEFISSIYPTVTTLPEPILHILQKTLIRPEDSLNFTTFKNIPYSIQSKVIPSKQLMRYIPDGSKILIGATEEGWPKTLTRVLAHSRSPGTVYQSLHPASDFLTQYRLVPHSLDSPQFIPFFHGEVFRPLVRTKSLTVESRSLGKVAVDLAYGRTDHSVLFLRASSPFELRGAYYCAAQSCDLGMSFYAQAVKQNHEKPGSVLIVVEMDTRSHQNHGDPVFVANGTTAIALEDIDLIIFSEQRDYRHHTLIHSHQSIKPALSQIAKHTATKISSITDAKFIQTGVGTIADHALRKVENSLHNVKIISEAGMDVFHELHKAGCLAEGMHACGFSHSSKMNELFRLRNTKVTFSLLANAITNNYENVLSTLGKDFISILTTVSVHATVSSTGEFIVEGNSTHISTDERISCVGGAPEFAQAADRHGNLIVALEDAVEISSDSFRNIYKANKGIIAPFIELTNGNILLSKLSVGSLQKLNIAPTFLVKQNITLITQHGTAHINAQMSFEDKLEEFISVAHPTFREELKSRLQRELTTSHTGIVAS